MKKPQPAVWVPPTATRGNLPLVSTGNGSQVKWGSWPNSTVAAPAPVSVSFPAGMMMDYAGASAPTGWLLCNGASLNTTTYATLFAIIGYTYGGGGASFNLPDTRNRMIIGAGSTYSLGSTGGAASTTLSISNMPSHNHSVNANHGHSWNDAGHTHTVTDPQHNHTISSLSHSHTISGGTHAHSAYTPDGYNVIWNSGGTSGNFLIGNTVPTSSTLTASAGRASATGDGTPVGMSASNGLTGSSFGNYSSTGISNSSNTSVVGSVADNTLLGGLATSAIGGGSSFSNLPPYIALNKIIKT